MTVKSSEKTSGDGTEHSGSTHCAQGTALVLCVYVFLLLPTPRKPTTLKHPVSQSSPGLWSISLPSCGPETHSSLSALISTLKSSSGGKDCRAGTLLARGWRSGLARAERRGRGGLGRTRQDSALQLGKHSIVS